MLGALQLVVAIMLRGCIYFLVDNFALNNTFIRYIHFRRFLFNLLILLFLELFLHLHSLKLEGHNIHPELGKVGYDVI